jgi:hypothetical protein
MVLLLESKGLSSIQMGPGRWGGNGAGVYKQFLGRRLIISLGKYTIVLQAEIYTILVCANKIQANARSEKYISICSDNQVDLEAIQAINTSPHWYNSAKRR